jgi:hypothetical protein
MRPLYNGVRNVRLANTRQILVGGARAYLERTRRELPIAFLPEGDVLLTRQEAWDLLALSTRTSLPRTPKGIESHLDRFGHRLHVYQDSRERFYSKNEVLRLRDDPAIGWNDPGQDRFKDHPGARELDLTGPVFRGNQYRVVRADHGHVSLPYHALAEQLGTSIAIARAIGRSGFFRMNDIEVHPTAVNRWLGTLREKVCAPVAGRPTVDVRSLRKRAFQLDVSEVQLLQIIEDQPVIMTVSACDISLDALRFPADRIDAALERFAKPPAGWVTRDEVEARCALLPHEFDHLRRSGFFGKHDAGKQLKAGTQLPLSALQHYRSRYVARRALRLPSHRHTPRGIFRPGYDVERATAARVYGKLRVFYRDSLDANRIRVLTGVEI